MPKRYGALPSQIIREMMGAGNIVDAKTENVRAASLDLTITDEIYRIEAIFQPRPGEPVREVIRGVNALPYDLRYPLEREVTYLAKLQESLALPSAIYAYCNPKSSTGRNDIQVRVIADGVPRYDAAAPGGFTGELWLAITSNSFPVRFSAGETLSQIRFFNRDTRFDEAELQVTFHRDKLLWNKRGVPFRYDDLKIRDGDGSIILTADISRKVVGWECLGIDRVLDFSRRHHYRETDFFRPLEHERNRIRLKRGGFYILYTRERVRVPPHLACEMVPMDERSGEYRSHYAGYIDPGWGWGKEGEGVGRRLVLEMRPFEDLVFRDNQPISKIRFERMFDVPEECYDAMPTSNYKEEPSIPPLAKQFRKAA